MSRLEIDKNSIREAIAMYEGLKGKVEGCQSHTDTGYITGELGSYYGGLGDNTKEQLNSLATNLSNAPNMASYSLDLYDQTDKFTLKQLELLINDLFTHIDDNNFNIEEYVKGRNTNELYIDAIIDKLGIIDLDEIIKIKNEINDFVEEDPKNIEIIINWINKIPDNFPEFNRKYQWDKDPNFAMSFENGKSSCEWFNVNGLNVRITNIVDQSSYPTLKELMNKTYCCDLINEMNNWPQEYIDLLGKREYIDVIVSDFGTTVGAAYYQSGNPYKDYIYLPMVLGDNNIYYNDNNYNYLKDTLVHEISHYLDAIVGVTQIGEFNYENADAQDKEFYQFVIDLMNNYMYGCQCINQHADTVSGFDNYKIDENNNFCEGFAEFLRASLVDEEAFIKLIGIDNYNRLFDTMKNMNRKSQDGYEYYPVISGDNKSITIMRTKDGVEEVYNPSEFQYDANGRVLSEKRSDGTIIKFEYYDNGYKKIIMSENGEIIEEVTHEEFENEDGKIIREISSNGKIYEEEFQYDENGNLNYTSREIDNNSGTTRETKSINGKRIKTIITDKDNNVIGEEEFYENGQKKSSYEKALDGREYHYDYDEDGNMTSSVLIYENGTKVEKNYYANGQEKSAVTTYNDGAIKSIDYDEDGNLMSTSFVKADGSVTTEDYYANGQKKSSHEVNANGREYHYDYDENGNMTRSVLIYENGTKVEKAYYANGQEKSAVTTYPDGSIASASYDENGNKIA